MANLLFYLITLTIWGSTWLAIKFQLGAVAPAWSVTYRFALAGILLLVYCLIRRLPLRFSRRDHLAMVLQGIFLFSANYLLFYIGTHYLVSGIVALVAALIAIANIINGKFFFKSTITLKVVIGSILGILGLCLVFAAEINEAFHDPDSVEQLLIGLGICTIATYVASLGNMLAKRSQLYQIPIIQGNGFSMCYGAIFTALVATLMGQPMMVDWSFNYVSSLLYLSIFGTIIAFGCYLKLLGNIGPERAAYIFVVTPIIALILSTYYEAFTWHIYTYLGLGIIVLGNILVLNKK